MERETFCLRTFPSRIAVAVLPSSSAIMSDDEEVVDPEKEKLKNLPPLHIRQCDLPEFLFKKVLLLVMDALKENKMEKDVAGHVKKKLDEDPEFNELPGKGPWQCIVGKSFAGAITNEAMHLMFFDVIPNQQTFLIFKSLAVQNV